MFEKHIELLLIENESNSQYVFIKILTGLCTTNQNTKINTFLYEMLARL